MTHPSPSCPQRAGGPTFERESSESCIHRRWEGIDPQRFAKIRGGLHDQRIDADTNRIGDAVQHAEVAADDRRRRDRIGT